MGRMRSILRSAACGTLLQGELKVVLCVIVRDVFNNFRKSLVIRREFPVLYPAADQVAQDTSEVFMSGVGQEASGVGQHADEVAQAA